MRKLLLFSFLIFGFNTLHAQDIIEQFLGDNLFPNKFIIANKLVRRDIFEYKLTRKGVADSVFSSATNFNYSEAGQLMDVASFDKENFLAGKIVYSYNNQGLIEKKVEHLYFKKLKHARDFAYTNEFTYDSVGHLELNVSYNQDTLFVNKEKREYDSKGQLNRIIKTTNNLKPYVSNLAEYDNYGNIETLEYYYKQHTPEYSYRFDTDTTENGYKVIAIDKLIPGKEEEHIATYKFNRYKQCTEIIDFQTVGLQKTKYTRKLIYNTDGTLYSSIFYTDKKIERMYKFYYHK